MSTPSLNFSTAEMEYAARQTRTRLGVLLGAVAGLLYGALAASINHLLLWGVPLHGGPGEIAMSAFLSACGLAAVGYIAAQSSSSIKGIAAGALGVAAYGVLNAYRHQTGGARDFLSATIILMTVFLPSAALALVIVAPLRWAVVAHEDGLHYEGRPRVYRVGRVWLVAVVVALLVGSTSQWPAEVRQAVRTVNDLVETALASGQTPEPLRTIPNFASRASPQYTVGQHSDVSADTSIAGSVAQQTIIVEVQFESGLYVECLLNNNMARPLCGEK